MTSRRPSTAVILLIASSSLLLVRCGDLDLHVQDHHRDHDCVTLVTHDRYHEVRIDYEEARHAGLSPYEVGEEYGRKVQDLGLPLASSYDAFLNQSLGVMRDTGVLRDSAEAFRAVELLKQQIPSRYRSEIDGLASQLSDAVTDLPGDGRLSVNELYLLHLFQDVFRTQCSAVSVYGRQARDRRTLTAFVMDLFGREALGRFHAVTTIVDEDRSVALVGFLGLVNAPMALNDDGVFVGVLSSEWPAPYDATGKDTVFFAVREALERESSLEDVANAVLSPDQRYTAGFNLSLADRRGAAVAEVDLNGRRALRNAASPLNPGVAPWPFDEAVASVNSFVLAGNSDNHTRDPINVTRWASLIEQLTALPHARIITSHDLEMILDVCPRVVLLDGGRIVADGPSPTILADKELMVRHRLEVPYSLRRDHRHRFPLAGSPHEREHRDNR